LEIENSLIYTYENITSFEKCEYYVYLSNANRTFKKSEIFKFNKSYYLSYLCKNNICTEVERHALDHFVEIPDEKGNKKIYIGKTCLYDEIKSQRYRNKKTTTIPCTSNQENKQYNNNCEKNVVISLDCTSNSQCLSNKCIDNVCVFNEYKPIDFCTTIYKRIIFRIGYTYMHCGKMIGEPCIKNKECGSNNCLLDGICGTTYGPSDTDGMIEYIILYVIAICVVIMGLLTGFVALIITIYDWISLLIKKIV